jgi:hypothetical protein
LRELAGSSTSTNENRPSWLSLETVKGEGVKQTGTDADQDGEPGMVTIRQ